MGLYLQPPKRVCSGRRFIPCQGTQLRDLALPPPCLEPGLNRNHHASSPEYFRPRKLIVPQAVQRCLRSDEVPATVISLTSVGVDGKYARLNAVRLIA